MTRIFIRRGRMGRDATSAMIQEIEALELDQLLTRQGFCLQPFRLPRGLENGNLRLRLVWKKTDGAEVQTVRMNHTVIAPLRR